MLKASIYIVIALIIDGLQALFLLMFVTIGSMAGTLGGASGLWLVCSKYLPAGVEGVCIAAGSFIGSFGNPFVAPFAIPVGIMMGFVMGIVISMTLGSAFVLLLAMDGMYYRSYILLAYLGETIPGFEILPAWTTLAALCVMRKMGEEGSGLMAVVAKGVTTAAAVATGNEVGAIKGASQTLAALQQARKGPQQQSGQLAAEAAAPRQRVELKSSQAWSDGVRPPKNPDTAAANDDSFRQAA